MKLDEIKSPLSSLPGIGPAQSKLFAKLNVFTIGDLLKFYPKDYDDRRNKNPLSAYSKGKIHTFAKILSHEWFGYGKMKTLKIRIADRTGEAFLICFNRPFLQNVYPEGSIICVSGTFFYKFNELQCSVFEAKKIADGGNLEDFENTPLPDAKIFPLYPLTEGLTQNAVRKAVSLALKQYNKGIETELPEYLMKERNILSKSACLKQIHEPENVSEISAAKYSLIYEELFSFQKTIALRALKHKGEVPESSLKTEVKDNFAQNFKQDFKSDFKKQLSPLQLKLYENLPFDLTEDQKSVILEMNKDIDKGYLERNELIIGKAEENTKIPFTMQRLLQGDVGSGKTLVCFFACLRAINWKGQCAVLAPTEILARQHAEKASELLSPLGIKVAFLTGNVKSHGRTILLKALKEGQIDIVIGTHALFSQDVVYKDLQLAVIDEQHRFGVVQRESIINKGRKTESSRNGNLTYEPHLLMMSATPIPQTLALTVFGDLDVSVIRTMPDGRKPVQTFLVREGHEKNAYEAVRRELKTGHQAYFVYPAIESEKNEGSTREMKSVEDAFRNLSQNVYPEYRTALLHSKVPEEDQIRILKDFREGKIQVLAATTVIEVGVDVPAATSIVIEQADCFGLAQLHQLRGRVGRGDEQAFCYLIYSAKITQTGIERMKILRQNTDGFIIAEEDLKLRGPGEINGTLQAGDLELGLADFNRDKEILMKARYDAFEYVRKIKSKAQ